MPLPMIKDLAKRAGKSPKEAEKIWRRAIQVAEEIHSLKGKKHLSVAPIYGGQSIVLQLRSLKKGIDIVVGTPGRILDHLKRKS